MVANIPKFDTPNKTISYVAFTLGTIGCLIALLTLLSSTPLLNAYVSHGLVWIIGFAILVATVIICIISTRKQIGSGIITYRAGVLAIVSAILLVISSILILIIK